MEAEIFYCQFCESMTKNNSICFEEKHSIFSFPTRITQDYEITRKMGSGGFGKVFAGIHRVSKKEYAIKLIQMDKYEISTSEKQECLSQMEREIAVMADLDHKRIIRYMNSYFFEKQFCAVIIMEMADSSLSDVMHALSFETALSLIVQICQGLDYLHNRIKPSLIHRDLKPQNILLKGGKVKICDFGISKALMNEKTALSNVIGTLSYMAPEVLEEEEKIDTKVDIWALGVIVHQMMTHGVHPFGDKQEIKKNVKKGLYKLSSEIKDERIITILKGCFQVDPQKRLSALEILAILKKENM